MGFLDIRILIPGHFAEQRRWKDGFGYELGEVENGGSDEACFFYLKFWMEGIVDKFTFFTLVIFGT